MGGSGCNRGQRGTVQNACAIAIAEHPARGNLDERTILIVSFGFGVALQAALLMRGDWSWGKLAGCLAMALVGLVPGKHEIVYQHLFHVLMVFSAFSVMFAYAFKEDILPLISEAVLLWYTLVFWYAFYAYHSSFYFDLRSPLDIALVLVLLVPTLTTVFIALRKTGLDFLLKLGLYTWFLVIIVCLGLSQFPFSQLALFYRDRQVPWISSFDSATAGMAFLFLLANAVYVYYLIPIPGKGQTFANRMKEWHEFTDLLVRRFDYSQTKLQTGIVLGIGGTALLLNALYRWLPSELAINLAVILPSVVFHPRLSTPAPESQARPTTHGDG
jgi:hypothetical protein